MPGALSSCLPLLLLLLCSLDPFSRRGYGPGLALAEPFAGHRRSCVSGQECAIAGLSGTGMSNGDSIMLLKTCGEGPVIDGLQGSFGQNPLGNTLAAVDGGSAMRWPDPITPDGGSYDMCWCGATDTCDSIAAYSYSVGTMEITGPDADGSWSCVSGRVCYITGITGAYLRNNDSVMVLAECGVSPGIEGFPNGARSTTGWGQGTEHGWGNTKIRAVGGAYSLCWCAKGYPCVEGIHHGKRVGSLTMIGPAGNFQRTCATFEECTWQGLTGTGLQDGDRIMVLEECGQGPIVTGFPNTDIAVASGGGSTYTFGTSNNMITAGGMQYALCWCQPNTNAGHVCSTPANFLVPAGTLTVIGARRDHDVSCVQGQICQISGFRGVGLSDGDKIKILIQCGQGTSPGGFPDNGVVSATGSGETYRWTSAVTAQFGTYRICWCRSGWTCPPTVGFKMDAGTLTVVGITAGQQRSCHVNDGCAVTNIQGNQLRNGDLLKILTSCDGGGQLVPGWPNGGTSFAATNSGRDFTWGLTERIAASPGVYKMCWCPAGHFSGCDDIADFSVTVGDMALKGPATMSKNGTCSAYQVPECIVGPFTDGAGFTPGRDKILLIKADAECRAERDTWVGGSDYGKVVQSDGLVYFASSDLPYGGVWKMCYCADYDTMLDGDAEPCSSAQDFPVAVGMLVVKGAYPDQHVNCTRNQECTFSIFGESLNMDIHRVAMRDSSTDCGAMTLLEQATRRRRDFTGNPYVAVDTVSDHEIVFKVSPIQVLDTYAICFCVPPPAANRCGSSTLAEYDQTVGALDIRGADPDQTFVCGRGGICVLEVTGRHLQRTDFVKVVNMSTDCSGAAHDEGFFRPLLPADAGITPTLAKFSLGRVTATGSFKVCYCASLAGCDAMAEYNHVAGLLVVLDPLGDLAIVSATAVSVTVSLTSRIENPESRIRCALSIYEPTYTPDAASIFAGLALVGLGKGESTTGTVNGTNTVEIFFDTFVTGGQQYRVWCVETSAQSFVLPGHPGGAIIVAPDGIVWPRLRVYPSYLWAKVNFFAELVDVFAEVIDDSGSEPVTAVRVSTGSTESSCNRAVYDEAIGTLVTAAGQPDSGGAVLISNATLMASMFRPYVCFFAGPRATAVAMKDDMLVVQAFAPTFSQKRIDGQVMTRFYRGMLMQVVFQNTAPYDGLVHWTNVVDGLEDCTGAARAPPAAKMVRGANTSFFRFDDAVGSYTMCYLGRQSESATMAPFNTLGTFEVTDVITLIRQDPALPSTRHTVRIEVQVRVEGTVDCLVRTAPADMTAGDFSEGLVYQGRGYLDVPPAPPGTDPEFPRRFTLAIPLLYYQQDVGPMHVWCHHSAAEEIVFPETREGALIPLQTDEAYALPTPSFLWTGARFKLELGNTPFVETKMVAVHEAKLPDGWQYETVVGQGDAQIIKFKNTASGTVVDENPVVTRFSLGQGPSPCEGSNMSTALPLTGAGFTETESWFIGKATSPFVCYWASQESFPHLVSVLDISAQPPTFQMEVDEQLRPYIYRGVDVTFRVKHTSPTGGRILVVRKATFDAHGGACQDMGLSTRKLSVNVHDDSLRDNESQRHDVETTSDQSEPSRRVGLVEQYAEHQTEEQREVRARRLQQCTNSPRRTSELKLLPAHTLFPTAEWGNPAGEGLNCTRDFKLYYSVLLPNTSILADKDGGMYFMITSDVNVLRHFFPRITLLSPTRSLPNTSVAIVLQDFTALDSVTSNDWVFSTRDCTAQVLLEVAGVMHEEGAEYLNLGEYEKAKLELQGFDFSAFVYLPANESIINVQTKTGVCNAIQPPAPPPKRKESFLDIDVPGLGRTVKDGKVWVPAKVNGSGSFLHNDPLAEYVLCYEGDETTESPIFNPIGVPFKSRDVLPPGLMKPSESMSSTSLTGYLNVTAMLRGVVRCVALLRTSNPPERPDRIFYPDTTSEDFVGASDPVQFDVPESNALIKLDLDQVKATFITPKESYSQAQPTMYVWCAHEASTLIYPTSGGGYELNLQARPPPPFRYMQLNRTVVVIQLTMQLEFTPIRAVFEDSLFPVNTYDQVWFTTRPLLPAGLNIDQRTGTITGKPEAAGNFTRTVVATSLMPPKSYSRVDLVIDVQDALDLQRRSVNVDFIVFTTMPRSTNIFTAEEVFVLIQGKARRFTNQPTEFFCLTALLPLPADQRHDEILCQQQDGKCCCAGYILPGRRVQDIRVSTAKCGFEQLSKQHAAGMVKGQLKTADGVRTTGLRSTREVDINVPQEEDPDKKSPVTFDLVVLMSLTDWRSNEIGYKEQLVEELHKAVAIPHQLVSVADAQPASGSGGGRRLEEESLRVEVSFSVEARCLHQRSSEVEMMSFGIDTKENCNLVAPKEYMDELRAQLTDEESALFEDPALELLGKVHPGKSFSYMKILWFCNQEPIWRYGAIAANEAECPYDMIKLGSIGLIAATIGLTVLFGVLCYLSSECASCAFLYKIRVLDVLTPLLSLYTTAADYVWLFMLNHSEGGGAPVAESSSGSNAQETSTKHPLFGTIFIVGLCHLLICFCVNAMALRITITCYILDTPWWRRNRKRLRPVLLLTTVAPRFFRITRANIFGFDSTHIHFGTPSKMAVVFSNLGLVCLLQDIPQLLIHGYVWFVFRNEGPRVQLVCFFLSTQSIFVAILHHVFSRSQRAAYERVVKLLGVRRLTAGFFDVSAGVQGQQGNLLESMRRAGNEPTGYVEQDDSNKRFDNTLDPTKLDPIQAAMYVSQMYEKEARNKAEAQRIGHAAESEHKGEDADDYEEDYEEEEEEEEAEHDHEDS